MDELDRWSVRHSVGWHQCCHGFLRGSAYPRAAILPGPISKVQKRTFFFVLSILVWSNWAVSFVFVERNGTGGDGTGLFFWAVRATLSVIFSVECTAAESIYATTSGHDCCWQSIRVDWHIRRESADVWWSACILGRARDCFTMAGGMGWFSEELHAQSFGGHRLLASEGLGWKDCSHSWARLRDTEDNTNTGTDRLADTTSGSYKPLCECWFMPRHHLGDLDTVTAGCTVQTTSMSWHRRVGDLSTGSKGFIQIKIDRYKGFPCQAVYVLPSSHVTVGTSLHLHEPPGHAASALVQKVSRLSHGKSGRTWLLGYSCILLGVDAESTYLAHILVWPLACRCDFRMLFLLQRGCCCVCVCGTSATG